ncbi:MAG: nitrous oxide reductase family maturation protein NosD [Saprospiraceae bacterium]
MKKLNWSFLLFILCIGNVWHPLNAREIHVGPGKTFTSIRQALFETKDNDTLWVHHSIYREGNIVINKSIWMFGVDLPVLDGQYEYEVVSIKANHVVFSGFKVQNSGFASINDPCGVRVYDGLGVTIENNFFENNFFGIYLQYSQHCIVKNNTLTATATDEHRIGNGVHCWKSDSLQIIGNRIEGHRDGIYFEFVTHSIIWRNVSKNNLRYGLHFMFSNNDAYVNNYFESNDAGVAVMYSKHVTMYGNTFIGSVGDAAYGILLKEISDAEIIGNRFSNNTAALFLDGANRILIQKNIFTQNGWGIKIMASCVDNKIEWNNFLKNTFDVSTNGSVVMNSFSKNYWDKYEGYDLDKNGVGDVPYHPLSIYSTIIENNPTAMLLFRSFMVTLLERTEKLIPSLTPIEFKDETPVMNVYKL